MKLNQIPKFRVWDAVAKVMLYPKEICFFSDHIGIPISEAEEFYPPKYLDNFEEHSNMEALEGMVYLMDSFVIMPSTNFIDNNDNEIYDTLFNINLKNK